MLPGLGRAKASAIVARRTQRPFAKVRELRSIRGIGKKLLARISPYVSLKGKTTLVRRRVKRPRGRGKRKK